MQGSAGSMEPGAAEVRAQLERILASRCFEQAARSSSFLRFVVEQTLAGQGDRLKGYTSPSRCSVVRRTSMRKRIRSSASRRADCAAA